MLYGQHIPDNIEADEPIYVAMNMHWESHVFQLPRLSEGRRWRLFADTSLPSPHDINEPGQERLLPDQDHYLLGARCVIILVGR